MNKTYSTSIRVSEEELNRLKQAAKLEAYSSYSEFVRRIALKEADKVIKKERKDKTNTCSKMWNELYLFVSKIIFGGAGMAKGKRAESRCRYLVRDIAGQKGWDVRHPQKGGDFLEEQEIEDFFPNCGLDGTKPDFIVCKKSLPLVVVEAKNDIKKIDNAILEAMEYADSINKKGKYKIRIAVGVAGEEDHGYLFKSFFWNDKKWTPLTSKGYELTSFPSVYEVDGALVTNNGTTEVSIPQISDYINTAIELSSILRSAKIEPSLRPKVLGAVITALYWGEINLEDGKELESINDLVSEAIKSTDHFEENKKERKI